MIEDVIKMKEQMRDLIQRFINEPPDSTAGRIKYVSIRIMKFFFRWLVYRILDNLIFSSRFFSYVTGIPITRLAESKYDWAFVNLCIVVPSPANAPNPCFGSILIRAEYPAVASSMPLM